MSFGKANRFTRKKGDDNPSPAQYNISVPKLTRSLTISKSQRFRHYEDEESPSSRGSSSRRSSRSDSGHGSSNSDQLSRLAMQKLKDVLVLYNRLELQNFSPENACELLEDSYDDDIFDQILKIEQSSASTSPQPSTSKRELSEIVHELTLLRKEFESLLVKHKDEVKNLMRAIEDLEKQMDNKSQDQLCGSQESKIKALEAKNRDIQNFYVKEMSDLYRCYERFLGELDAAINDETRENPSEKKVRMWQFDFKEFITKMKSDVQHLQQCFEEEHETFSKNVEEKLQQLIELSSESKTRINEACNQMVAGWKNIIEEASDSSALRRDERISRLQTLKEKVLAQKSIVSNMVSKLDLSDV